MKEYRIVENARGEFGLQTGGPGNWQNTLLVSSRTGGRDWGTLEEAREARNRNEEWDRLETDRNTVVRVWG